MGSWECSKDMLEGHIWLWISTVLTVGYANECSKGRFLGVNKKKTVGKTEAPCLRRCGTIKIPPCSRLRIWGHSFQKHLVSFKNWYPANLLVMLHWTYFLSAVVETGSKPWSTQHFMVSRCADTAVDVAVLRNFYFSLISDTFRNDVISVSFIIPEICKTYVLHRKCQIPLKWILMWFI
jgi:hypothetical protein